MPRRGDRLHNDILWAAKDVFLRMGFQGASMDAVADAAGTSKRSVYSHYESKENLFLAVIDCVRGLFLSRLRMPADYAEKPAEALVLFSARYLEILLYEGSIRMCRMCMAETARFPKGAAEHFDVMFAEVENRLSSYLKKAFDLSPRASGDMANKLLGQLLYPRFPRALFGIDPLAKSFDAESLSPTFDLQPIRIIVTDFIGRLPKSAGKV